MERWSDDSVKKRRSERTKRTKGGKTRGQQEERVAKKEGRQEKDEISTKPSMEGHLFLIRTFATEACQQSRINNHAYRDGF